MQFKKLVVHTHVFKIGPIFRFDRNCVKIIDPCPLHRKQEGRVRGDYKLTIVKPRRILNKLTELILQCGRKAVFSGMGKEDLAGWAIEMGGIIKDDEFKSVFVKGLRTKAEFLIAPPEKEDDEKSKGGK